MEEDRLDHRVDGAGAAATSPAERSGSEVELVALGAEALGVSGPIACVEEIEQHFRRHSVAFARVALWIGERPLQFRDGHPLSDVLARMDDLGSLAAYVDDLHSFIAGHDEDERYVAPSPLAAMPPSTILSITLKGRVGPR